MNIVVTQVLFRFICSNSAKIVISGIPQHAHFDDIEPLLKSYGKVEHCDAVASKDPNSQTVHITFESYEQAQKYVFVMKKQFNFIIKYFKNI